MGKREFLFHYTLPEVGLLVKARVARNDGAEQAAKKDKKTPASSAPGSQEEFLRYAKER